jgi:AcrR family transcriptional regulator
MAVRMTKHQPEATRRNQILEAARKLFVERGYVATKMSDIAELAGLSKGGVYFHFVSKEDVFGALVEDEFQRSMGFLTAVTDTDFSMAQLERIGQHFFNRFHGESDTARFFIVMGEMALRDKDLRAKLAKIQKSYIDAVAQVVERGVSAGLMRPVNPRAAAFVWKALMDGLEGNAALDSDGELKNVGFDALMDVVLGGVLVR